MHGLENTIQLELVVATANAAFSVRSLILWLLYHSICYFFSIEYNHILWVGIGKMWGYTLDDVVTVAWFSVLLIFFKSIQIKNDQNTTGSSSKINDWMSYSTLSILNNNYWSDWLLCQFAIRTNYKMAQCCLYTFNENISTASIHELSWNYE